MPPGANMAAGGGGGCVEGFLADNIRLAGAGLHLGSGPDADTGRWYAVYVRSRHEKVVESGLRGKGYAAFSPFYRTKRRRVDRIAELDVPLFPGYVFCHFDANRRLPILVTPGIVGVVGRGNRPQPVEDHEIASVRTIALSGSPVQPWPFLRSGQRIRLQDGPLTGAEGIFLRVKDEYHLVVSITLLQRAVSVVIEKDAVAPLFIGERHAKSFES
jgi:transcription antitermination factor NusG